MAQPPVKLIKPDALHLDAAEPCLLEFHIPIPLPHRLDPSLPAPPYILNHDDHPNPTTYNNRPVTSPEDLQTIHARPLIRHLISQTLSHLFNLPPPTLPPPSSTTTPPPSGGGPDPSLGGTLLNSWDCAIVPDKQGGFDFAAGWWRDQYGKEGRGTILAYNEAFDGVELLHAMKFHLVRGVEEPEALTALNPRVLRFDVVEEEGEEEEEEGVVVFGVREYTEDTRGRYRIPEAAWIMELVQREARELAAAAAAAAAADDDDVAAADVAAA
ncbi:hypothetical protein C8A00DRAFT_15315 [Chaetomidium leptoderma]|uniref:Uncharacterized protein n=1 Tax=Chaetomidium leptoderma TaxID=669021 RepID=A0AAN6VLG6_9PEZI|nr:hypothetical protein C8A00DRAFT_15315 [Chaetomidium leptoderma]